jgi:hypothetical protein
MLAIMTAGLAIPLAAHAVGGSPQFPFCASSPVTTYGEFVYRDQWTWVQCDTSAVEHSGRRSPDSVDWARR